LPDFNLRIMTALDALPAERKVQRERECAFRFRVAAAFPAEADRSDALRWAEASSPNLPPLWLEAWDIDLPRPLPDFFPP
jgi:hypothetical protein